jgi:prepilin-type processing-associated H-X9-DG protein
MFYRKKRPRYLEKLIHDQSGIAAQRVQLCLLEMTLRHAAENDYGSMLFPPLTNPNVIPNPNSSMPIIQSIYSSCLQSGTIGHTDWTYANSIYDGFTTALPPNTVFEVAPGIDLDVNTEDENNGGPTYAAVTARSYHPDGVNALFCDGSVRFINNSVNWATWRALGTIASGELVSRRLLRLSSAQT